ncbi:MAG: trehalose-phosphatase, partial [Frankiales bacterium]|nr:trehalose-phosphatase [Frankiales bacterium]
VPGLIVLGQYGAQRWRDGVLSGAAQLPGVAGARADLPALLEVEGAWWEDKGLSLVVHTRTAPDPVGALARLTGPVTELGRAHGLEVHRGRLVLELRPPGFDKGVALASLCAPEPSAVVFAGDDLGDLAAFDELDRQRSRGIPGLAVCSASAEGPVELRDRADVVVDGPAGVVAFLAGLLRR